MTRVRHTIRYVMVQWPIVLLVFFFLELSPFQGYLTYTAYGRATMLLVSDTCFVMILLLGQHDVVMMNKERIFTDSVTSSASMFI